jgi:hypothetical protein
MIPRALRLMFLLSLGVPLPPAGAAAPPRCFRDPVKGVVTSRWLLSCAPDPVNRGVVAQALVTPLDKGVPAANVDLTFCDIFPPRFHVRRGVFWILSMTGPGISGTVQEGLDRYELAELLQGKAVAAPGAKVGKINDAFSYPTAGHLVWTLTRIGLDFQGVVHADVLPIGPYQAREFVLTNVRGRISAAGNAGQMAAFRLGMDPKDRETPHWSFTVHRCRSVWDRQRQRWQRGDWIKEESLPVVFKEPFQALGQGGDYFFVTRSGQLFVARKPAKGKQRSIERVWNDPSRRIIAIVSDADTDRHFLFCQAAKAGEQPCYFELSSKPRPTRFDPALAPLPKTCDDLGRILHFARVLVALKKIKGQ